MKIIIKKLQGEECFLEVLPTTYVSDIKRQIAAKLNIPIEQQKLLFLGRTLADEQTLQAYPSIKDGTKLNLVVKKPEGLYEVSLRYFKSLGMSELDAANAANRLLKVAKEKFYKLSWDEIDRMAYYCLLEERGERDSPVIMDNENDDLFSLN